MNVSSSVKGLKSSVTAWKAWFTRLVNSPKSPSLSILAMPLRLSLPPSVHIFPWYLVTSSLGLTSLFQTCLPWCVFSLIYSCLLWLYFLVCCIPHYYGHETGIALEKHHHIFVPWHSTIPVSLILLTWHDKPLPYGWLCKKLYFTFPRFGRNSEGTDTVINSVDTQYKEMETMIANFISSHYTILR